MTPRYPFSGRGLPSPSLCLALLALFISLGGTTYAVTSLPRNSVGTEQLRDRAVTEDELSNRSVITRKLANGAVTNRKIARARITGSRLAPDTLGGLQIDENLLSAVPLAEEAERAKIATRATTADRVDRVERALRADTAETAALAERASHADRAAQADQADHATQADRAAVADALSVVDLNLNSVVLEEGTRDIFTVECDPGLVPVGGGYIQTGDFADIPYLSASAPTSPDGWAAIVVDEFRDTGEPTPGNVYVICVRAND
jgi:hypothetical protein